MITVYYHRELTFEPTLPPSDDPLSPSDPIGPVFYPDDSYWMNGLQKVRFDDCKRQGANLISPSNLEGNGKLG